MGLCPALGGCSPAILWRGDRPPPSLSFSFPSPPRFQRGGEGKEKHQALLACLRTGAKSPGLLAASAFAPSTGSGLGRTRWQAGRRPETRQARATPWCWGARQDSMSPFPPVGVWSLIRHSGPLRTPASPCRVACGDAAGKLRTAGSLFSILRLCSLRLASLGHAPFDPGAPGLAQGKQGRFSIWRAKRQATRRRPGGHGGQAGGRRRVERRGRWGAEVFGRGAEGGVGEGLEAPPGRGLGGGRKFPARAAEA